MTALNKQALRVPERKRRDWSHAVMRDCDFCSQWALTVKHDDGGHICASCCDAEYTSELKCALESAIDRAEAAEKRIAETIEYYRKRVARLKARSISLTLPPRKTLDDYIDEEFDRSDLAAIYNACRLECEVKFKSACRAAGIGVKGE